MSNLSPQTPILDYSNPGDFWAEADFLAQALVNQVDYFKLLGVDSFPAEIMPPQLPARAPQRPPITQKATTTMPSQINKAHEPESTSSTIAKSNVSAGNAGQNSTAAELPNRHYNDLNLAELSQTIALCQACARAQTRISLPSLGQGTQEQPLLAVVVKDPSDFQEECGEFLQSILTNGLELSPADYYLTSALKCPGEASFQAMDKHPCQAILWRELTLIQPRAILAFGQASGQILSGQAARLPILRGRTHFVPELSSTPLRITYALEQMLASQEIKNEAWLKDLKNINLGLKKMKDPQQSNLKKTDH